MIELLGTLCVALALGFIIAAQQLWKCDRESSRLRFRLHDALEELHAAEDENTDMFERWSDSARSNEERAIKAAARYHAGTMKYEEHISAANARWISATKQNANLAEQLATIRLAHPEAYSESEEHIEDVSPSVPYSMELADWLAGLENTNARELAIEFIEDNRKYGIDDEQIIEKLEEEWTA